MHLQDIPDFAHLELVEAWVYDRLKTLTSISFDHSPNSFVSITAPQSPSGILGCYGNADWRRFALGVFLADWACYQNSADRVDFPRLLSVLSTFPQGFKLWLSLLSDGTWTPVGYTGWYPISSFVFEIMKVSPESINHRGYMSPLRELSTDGNFIYIFNYSVIQPLKCTRHSATLIKSLAHDIAQINHLEGVAAVAVSNDGRRIAERFNMRYRGDMEFGGEAEGVYTT